MMNRKWLYNPFEKIAGVESAGLGLAGLLVTSYLAYISGAHHYGYLNTDFATDSPFWVYLLEHGMHAGLIIIFLYISGVVFSKSEIRPIDVFGTVLLAQLPLILVPVFRVLPWFEVVAVPSAILYVHMAVFLLASVWSIVLTYHAFRISCNPKKGALAGSFVASMVLSEIIIKFSIQYLTK